MLFACHQMAMEREAKEKYKRQQSQNSAQPKTPDTNVEPTIPIIWVLGGPGCGKGTQCAKIVEKYGFTHLSTGDLLRAEVASGSEKGKALQEIMKKGDLVSNDDVLDLLKSAMLKLLDGCNGFLIDGYPREKNQGISFEQTISPADVILYFECKPQTMIDRVIARAQQSAEVREDDNEVTIKNRIDTFTKNTDEILALYPEKTQRINAEREISVIFADIEKIIDGTLASKQKSKIAATS